MFGNSPPVTVLVTGVAFGVAFTVVFGVAEALTVLVPEALVVQASLIMVLVSSVTEPFRASNWPLNVAPVFAVIEDNAKTCPTKFVVVPKVADEATCQNT